jgi:hypothetical protein
LKNSGTAEAAMGEEHLFTEAILSDASYDLAGDSGEFGIAAMIGAIEDERDKGWTRENNLVAELAGEVVAERGGAHFGDGKTPGGDDENRRAEFLGRGAEDKFG